MKPRRILMTVDAVGGVWRYALDAARALATRGVEIVLLGFGPAPSVHQRAEAETMPGVKLVWLDDPLDWMVDQEAALDPVARQLENLVQHFGIDLLHLNLPSQAVDLHVSCPLVVVSHSCVITWWQGVHGTAIPLEWQWKYRRNRNGFDAATRVLAPSRSHADALERAYGPIPHLDIVYNASVPLPAATKGHAFAFAAGRWWDEAKNGSILDRAAPFCTLPVVMAGAMHGPNGQVLKAGGVQAMGETPGHQVRQMMAQATVFVAPSLYEPFGLVALEAALAGTALVLSDIPVFRELWDGAALFADPHDPTAFAHAINAIAADPAERSRLEAEAKSRAAHFTLERQATALLDIYAKAMDQDAEHVHHHVAAAE